MPILSLDAEALSAIAHGPKHRQDVVQLAIDNARRLRRRVVVCTAVLAELIRGRPRDAAVNAAIRRCGFQLRDVDRKLADKAGQLLGAAQMDSRHAIDAFVAATTSIEGGGVIVTGDPDDLERLAGPLRNVHVKAI